MADNFEINAGSGGGTVRADEASDGFLYQFVKLADGTADSTTPIYAANGVAANALRVTLASDSTGQVVLAAGSATVGEFTIGAASTAVGDLAKAEDQAHVSGAVGIMSLAVRMDAPANLSGTDGDYEPLQVSDGKVWTRIEGEVADDAASTANPVIVGSVAVESDGTDPGSVDAGDAAYLRSDLNRRLLVTTTHPNHFNATDNESTAQTNTALKAAPGEGLHLYVTDIVVSADAAQTIKFVEDTGGTPVDVVEVLYLAADSSVVIPFATPLRLSENVDFGYTSTAAVAHSVTVNGYIAP